MDLKGSAAANNSRVAKYLSNAGAAVPQKYAEGGHVGKKGGTTIQINIAGQKPAGPDPMAAAAMAAASKPPLINPPPAAPPMPPPGMGGPPPGGPPMPPGMGPPGMKRGGSAKSEAGTRGVDRTPKDGDQEYGTTLMGRMAKGGRATAMPREFGTMSGVGREVNELSQAKASGQTMPIKGTAVKRQKKALGRG